MLYSSSPLASASVHNTDVVSTTYSIDDESLNLNTKMQNGEERNLAEWIKS